MPRITHSGWPVFFVIFLVFLARFKSMLRLPRTSDLLILLEQALWTRLFKEIWLDLDSTFRLNPPKKNNLHPDACRKLINTILTCANTYIGFTLHRRVISSMCFCYFWGYNSLKAFIMPLDFNRYFFK